MSTPRILRAVLVSLLLAAALPAQVPELYDPTIVRDYRLTFKQTNYWTLLIQNKFSKTDIKADMVVDGKKYKDVGVRFRGNTSYSYNPSSEKKPFNITMDSFVKGQDLYGYTNLNLPNSYKDATFMRDVVTYELMRRYVPSLKACWIRLWINNVCWGIYPNIQQPNKKFLRDWFKDDEGNLYRGDAVRRNSRPALNWLGNNVLAYQGIYDYKTVNHPKAWVDLIKLCDVLNNTPLANMTKELPKILNVDRALMYIALNNVLSNTDSYLGTGNDYYAYHDEWHDRFQIMPWDLNTAFGGYDYNRLGVNGLKTMSPYYKGWSTDQRPLITQLMAVPQYKQHYLAHFRTLLDEIFEWSKIEPIIKKYHKMIEPYVKADTKKLYSTQQFYDNVTKQVTVRDRFGSYPIPGLKEFVDARRKYLSLYFDILKPLPTLANVGHAPKLPKATDIVAVSVKAGSWLGNVTLNYRERGVFKRTPMFDDGKHGDGPANDGVYGAFIPAKNAGTVVEYYVEAAAPASVGSAIVFHPRRVTHDLLGYRVTWPRANSLVRINELLAKNKTGLRDESNQLEDWLELYNTSKTSAPLSGLFLTDDLTKPMKWRIPNGHSLSPAGNALVWLDKDEKQGPLHANFKLRGSGELVALFDRDGKTLLDLVDFGQQVDDVSLGFLADGGGPFTSLFKPTPGKPYHSGNCGVVGYSHIVPNLHQIALSTSGSPKIGRSIRLDLSNGVANSFLFVVPSATPAYLPLGGQYFENLVALVGLPLDIWLLPSDKNGSFSASLPIPLIPALKGQSLYLQAYAVNINAFKASNGIAITFCGQ